MHFALIGYPIGHSLSPALFRAAYPQMGNSWSYDLIETPELEEAISIFKEKYDAVNVTAPFKESALKYADSADDATSFIGATNLLLKRPNGKIEAYNTDYQAVYKILTENLSNIYNNVLVIGCGGAGKAAAYAAHKAGFKVTIANRDYDKACNYCRKFAGNISPARIDTIPQLLINHKFIIYTIPQLINSFYDKHTQKIIDLSDKTIFEANYRNPALSCENYISGKRWLAEQALFSFDIMTGIKPPEISLIN